MNWPLLQNSLLTSAGATLLAVVTGLLAALCLASLERRWRNCALVLAVTALALPPFLVTNCWLHFLGANGAWRSWLPLNIYSLPGAAWILALQLWPVTALAVWAAWRKLEPPLLEAEPAARGSTLLRGLLLPLAGRALGLSALLTFVLALNNFAVPAILQIKVLPAEVWVQFSTNLDPLGALRAGWPLILAPLLALPWLFRRDIAWPRVASPVSPRLFRRQLGGLLLTVSALAALALVVLSVVLPLAQILGASRTWTELFGAVEAGQSAVWSSFWFAAVTATVVVGAGLGMAMGMTNVEGRMSKENRSLKSEKSTRAGVCFGFRFTGFFRVSAFGFWSFPFWLAFFVPGVLLGIGLIAVFNRPAFFWLYRGAGIVLVALAVRYLALGSTGAALALRQTDADLADAARLDGASRWQLLRHVLWPQIAPPVAALWYVVYLLCLWDVESLVLIVPPGGETLALRVFNLLHYGHNAQVNALCLTLLALALLPLLAAAAFLQAREALASRRCVGVPLKTATALASACLLAGCGQQPARNEAPLDSAIFSKAVVLGTRGIGVGQFNKPRSVAVDQTDNVYAVDMTGRVQKFSPTGEYLLAWQMPQTDLGKPKGMAHDETGNLIVIEPHYQRVNYFSPGGKLIAQWGQRGTNAGQLIMPRAAAVNSRGEIFVSEYGAVERVQKFSGRDGKFLGGFGHAGTGPGEFNRPEGLAVDAQGRVYVADSCNHRVQVFDRDGKFLRAFGQPGRGRGELSYPYDVCVDPAGRVYVSEFGNSRIQVFDPNGASLEIIGGPGAAPGQFDNPWALALDSHGNLYVADALNNRLQKLVRRTTTAAKEIRNPKPEARKPKTLVLAAAPANSGFQVCFGFRISDFGFQD